MTNLLASFTDVFLSRTAVTLAAPLLVDLELLDDRELARAERFVNGDDRSRYIGARAHLRRLLGERLGRSPGEVVLGSVGRGKPVVLGSDDVHFNLTHSGTTVVVALADVPVGVDVELVRTGAWDLDMAARVLSPAERDAVRASSDPDREFFRAWTRKEAFAKVDGGGLVDQLATLTLLDSGPVSADGIWVTDDSMDRDLVLAVAVRAAHPPRLGMHER